MSAKAAVEHLLAHPERYVPVAGSYADGYIDALLDLSEELGLLEFPLGYAAMRRKMVRDAARGTAEPGK